MIKPPPSSEVNRIADWIELYVLINNSSISKSKVISILQKDSVTVEEEDIDSSIQELKRRLDLYGIIKPYVITGNNITSSLDWKEHPEHVLCLYYSTYGVGKTQKGARRDMGTKLFEDITKACLENGFDCPSTMFGFPNPLPFKKQLDAFAKAINEKRYDDPEPHDKDRDVDLIVYKQLDDIRNNCILIFVQCAAGKNWDEKKVVAIESYRRYISFSLKSTVASLSITQVVDIADWNNACDDYGIVIDRARLFRMYTSKKNVLPKKLNQEITEWCKANLN